MNVSEPRCYVCRKTESDDPDNVEIRPYGAGGQPICFDCMMGSAETRAEAERQFGAKMAGAGLVAVLDGTCGGVRPATFEEERLASDVLPGLPRPGRA